MTKNDADRIRQAAILMLHVVQEHTGDDGKDLTPALRLLPVHDSYRDWITLAKAREILEATPAWQQTVEEEEE